MGMDYTKLIKRGHFLYWDMLASLRGMENNVEAGLHWLSGDIFYNYYTESNIVRAELVNQIIERMKLGELPKNLSFLTTGDHKSEPCKLFMETGLFTNNSGAAGMARDLTDISPALPKPDKRLNIFRAYEIAQVKMVGAVLNSVFEYRIFSLAHFADMMRTDGLFFYLAEYDGLPVGACMSQHGEGIVNISWVGTLPGYRKLGIGGYLVNAAERDGLVNGKTVGTLRAMDGAAGTYNRLGYREYGWSAQIELKD